MGGSTSLPPRVANVHAIQGENMAPSSSNVVAQRNEGLAQPLTTDTQRGAAARDVLVLRLLG